MKVYISADIEGVCGVVDIDHTKKDGRDYAIARTLMVKEVNAAVDGAYKGGASEVVVNDSHGSMRNLIAEDLDQRVSIITGSPKPMAMLQGVEGCQAAFFIGYHSRAGSLNAVLDHTYHGRVVYNVRINKTELGECGVNALLAGYFGVPVILVTGDRNTTNEALDLLKTVEIVPTKEAIGRFAAQSMHPSKVREEIREKAQKAVKRLDKFHPFVIDPPYLLEMDFMLSHMADAVEMVPGITRVSGRCVQYECSDFLDLFRMMRVMILMASTGV